MLAGTVAGKDWLEDEAVMKIIVLFAMSLVLDVHTFIQNLSERENVFLQLSYVLQKFINRSSLYAKFTSCSGAMKSS